MTNHIGDGDEMARPAFHGQTCGGCAWLLSIGEAYSGGFCRRVTWANDGNIAIGDVPKAHPACPAWIAKFVAKEAQP